MKVPHNALASLLYFIGILDFILNFPGYHRWKFAAILRNVLKIVVSLAWAIILPFCYLYSLNDSPVILQNLQVWLRDIKYMPPLYYLAVAAYLLPNILAGVFFVFPMLRRWLENSDWHIIRFLLWWSQVFVFC